jgi:hypothetical protein
MLDAKSRGVEEKGTEMEEEKRHEARSNGMKERDWNGWNGRTEIDMLVIGQRRLLTDLLVGSNIALNANLTFTPVSGSHITCTPIPSNPSVSQTAYVRPIEFTAPTSQHRVKAL